MIPLLPCVLESKKIIQWPDWPTGTLRVEFRTFDKIQTTFVDLFVFALSFTHLNKGLNQILPANALLPFPVFYAFPQICFPHENSIIESTNFFRQNFFFKKLSFVSLKAKCLPVFTVSVKPLSCHLAIFAPGKSKTNSRF